MSPHAAAFLTCVAAFAALALAMLRHQEDLFGTALSVGLTRALRGIGWALLALALVWLVPALGWGRALVAYSGHTSMAAGLVFIALLAWERWKVRRAPGRSK